MHTRQSIYLCQGSCKLRDVMWGTCTSASVMGRHSLSVCCLCLCFELALVTLCRQRSSVIHMHMDPSCLLQHCPAFEHGSGLFPPPTLPCLFCMYCALFPLCVGAHGWCQDLPAMGAVSSRSRLPIVEAPGCLGALNLHLGMLLLMSGKLHGLVWSFWQPWAFWWLSILGITFCVKVIRLRLLCVFFYQFPSGWNCTSVFFYHKTDPFCVLPTNICSTMNSNKVMFPQVLINSFINY